MLQLAGGGDAFFFSRLPTAAVQGCVALTNAGFAVIDTGVTLAWAGSEEPARARVQVQVAGPEQHERILGIAATGFRWSRFHLDPRISTQLANRIKRRWIESYVQGKRGSLLYVAVIDGAPVGFLAVIEATVENRPAAIIDLLGVDPDHEGRGVGSALVHTFVSAWQSPGRELRVSTQAANIRSLGFYERQGFRIVETSYALHAHLRRGEVCR